MIIRKENHKDGWKSRQVERVNDDTGYRKATKGRQELAKGGLNPGFSVHMVPEEEKNWLNQSIQYILHTVVDFEVKNG